MSIKLTDEQKANVLNEWNNRPDAPPSLLELIRIAYPDKEYDGRTKEGRAVKKFLATRQIVADGAHVYKPKDKIELTEEHKEYISNIKKTSKTASFLIRQIDDVFGRLKLESLKNTFEINEISDLKYGVIWNIKVNSGNFDSTLNSILETNILFNPLSYECYRIR